VPAAVAVVVILILGIVGFVVVPHLRGSGGGGVASTSPSPRTSPKTSPKASPTPTGSALLPVPDYAPAANPPLTSVKFCSLAAPCAFGGGVPPATDTNCTLEGSCHVDIAAYWTGTTVTTLTFTVEFFDRCSNPSNDSTVVFQHNYSKVGKFSFDPAPAGGFPLTLPTGAKAAALVVVADTGTVKAASAPILLGSDSCA
jgi:hypothetical protein